MCLVVRVRVARCMGMGMWMRVWMRMWLPMGFISMVMCMCHGPWCTRI
jgi:hypothetical protein